MRRTSPLLLLALLLPLSAQAQAPRTQYIDDEISVTLREAPSNDAAYLGVVRSGDRVTVLESLGPQSFARIRTAEGREGWITARFLTDEPAARDALDGMRRELATARARIQSLERELADARSTLNQARPALELAQDNEALQQRIAELQQGRSELESRFDEERARRRTMLTGAGLVGAGALLGLLLPWLGSVRRRRRWGDF